MNIQRKIKSIMSKNPAQREIELRKLATELGCSLTASHDDSGMHLEDEVIRRIHEAARSIRESRLWWIAFFSASASVLSALASWLAVWSTR